MGNIENTPHLNPISRSYGLEAHLRQPPHIFYEILAVNCSLLLPHPIYIRYLAHHAIDLSRRQYLMRFKSPRFGIEQSMHGNGDNWYIECQQLFSKHAHNHLEMLWPRHLLYGATDLYKRVLKSHLFAKRTFCPLLPGNIGHRTNHPDRHFFTRIKKNFGFTTDPSHLATGMHDSIFSIIRSASFKGLPDLLLCAIAIIWINTRQPLGLRDHCISWRKTKKIEIPVCTHGAIVLDIPIKQTNPTGFERMC